MPTPGVNACCRLRASNTVTDIDVASALLDVEDGHGATGGPEAEPAEPGAPPGSGDRELHETVVAASPRCALPCSADRADRRSGCLWRAGTDRFFDAQALPVEHELQFVDGRTGRHRERQQVTAGDRVTVTGNGALTVADPAAVFLWCFSR